MYLSFFCFHQCMFIVCKCIVCFYQSMCIRVFHLSLFLEFSLANFMSDDDSPQEYGDFLSEFFYNGLLPPFASKVSSILPFSWYFNHIRTFYTELAALNAIHHFLCLEKSFKTSSHTIWIKPIWNSPFTLLIVILR